jgi:hypothetical protein
VRIPEGGGARVMVRGNGVSYLQKKEKQKIKDQQLNIFLFWVWRCCLRCCKVMITRIVWLTHARVWFQHGKCNFNTHECDFYTQRVLFPHAECDSYTQSEISTPRVWFFTQNVIFTHTSLILTHIAASLQQWHNSKFIANFPFKYYCENW